MKTFLAFLAVTLVILISGQGTTDVGASNEFGTFDGDSMFPSKPEGTWSSDSASANQYMQSAGKKKANTYHITKPKPVRPTKVSSDKPESVAGSSSNDQGLGEVIQRNSVLLGIVAVVSCLAMPCLFLLRRRHVRRHNSRPSVAVLSLHHHTLAATQKEAVHTDTQRRKAA